MASSLTQLRVFLASPGGLDAERKLFSETIDHFNKDHGLDLGFVIVATGWEQIPSGTGRPQCLINKEVRSSDYLVALIWDRWGTATSTDAKYSSGTQEEMVVAMESLCDPNAPMQDIAIYFKAVEERQLDDAGPQLTRVLDFKQELEDTKKILFRTFDKREEWQQLLTRRLLVWVREFSDKVSQTISIPSLVDWSLDATPNPIESEVTSQYLARAREFEGQGLIAQAEVAYAAAVSTDDRESLISYAKFLRRTGRLERAFEINERILKLENLFTTPARSSAVDRSSVIANMGVIRRKQGKLGESQQLFEEAIKTARTRKDAEGRESEAYALDNLGLTLRLLGDSNSALNNHKAALNLREELKDELGKAKTELNISRILRDQGQLRPAKTMVENAIVVLQDVGDEQRTLANAHSTLGDISQAEGDLDEACRCYEECLRLNEELVHSDGIAIASGQLAELSLFQGALGDALAFAERCLRENTNSGNQTGVAVALRIFGDIKAAAGELIVAKRLFQNALDIFRVQGHAVGVRAVEAKLTAIVSTEFEVEHLG